MSKRNIMNGQHTEDIILAENPNDLIKFFGHCHGLVVPGICRRCSNQQWVSAMNVDGMP